MANIGNAAMRVLEVAKASQPSPSNVPAKRGAEIAPAWFDRETDVEMPNRLFSAWQSALGPRQVRRALTVSERGKLEARAAALSAGLIPFSRDQEGLVDAEIAAMFNGFRSMRQQGEDVAFTVEVTRRVLREFPLWAIAEGCMAIAQRRAVTNPPLDARWPPNDGQIFEVVAGVVKHHRKALSTVTALLEATVEPPAPPRQEPPEQGEQYPQWMRAADLGPLENMAPPDGKHAQRVMADIEARKAQRTAAEG